MHLMKRYYVNKLVQKSPKIGRRNQGIGKSGNTETPIREAISVIIRLSGFSKVVFEFLYSKYRRNTMRNISECPFLYYIILCYITERRAVLYYIILFLDCNSGPPSPPLLITLKYIARRYVILYCCVLHHIKTYYIAPLVLHYIIINYITVLRFITLYFTPLRYIILYCIIMRCVTLYIMLYYINIPYSIIWHYNVFRCVVLFCITRNCIILIYIILYYKYHTALHRIM